MNVIYFVEQTPNCKSTSQTFKLKVQALSCIQRQKTKSKQVICTHRSYEFIRFLRQTNKAHHGIAWYYKSRVRTERNQFGRFRL